MLETLAASAFFVVFNMKQIILALCFSLALATPYRPKGPNKEGTHYFGVNGTLPKTMHNMGTITVAG